MKVPVKREAFENAQPDASDAEIRRMASEASRLYAVGCEVALLTGIDILAPAPKCKPTHLPVISTAK